MSLLTTRCIGACGIAPAITIDGNVAGKQTGESVLAAVQELIKKKNEVLTNWLVRCWALAQN